MKSHVKFQWAVCYDENLCAYRIDRFDGVTWGYVGVCEFMEQGHAKRIVYQHNRDLYAARAKGEK